MRYFLAFVLIITFAGEARSAASGIPTEYLTPELAAYLKSDHGKATAAAMKASLMPEYQNNRADPALAEYFKLLDEKNFVAAFKEVQVPALAGHAQAQTELGYLYLSGSGTEKNVDQAIKWLSSASDKGNLMATALLGSIYLLPNYGRQDLSRALPILNKCALKLRPSCVLGIVKVYASQNPPDIANAFAWSSIGKDFDIPAAADFVSQLQPYMDDALYKKATVIKSATLGKILGR